MKNTFRTILFLLLVLTVPSTPVLALGLNDSVRVELVGPFGANPNQGIIDALSGVSNAIKRNTEASQNTVLQKHIDALNPECVRQVQAQIKEKATDLQQIDRMINDYIAKNSNNSDPDASRVAASHLNSLSIQRGMIVQDYTNKLIDYCSKATASEPQKSVPSSTLLCNGKSWNACPAGKNFYCPASGDAQCTLNQPVVVDTKTVTASDGKVSCEKPVFGETKYFGIMTSEECFVTWQQAVEARQKQEVVAVKSPRKPDAATPKKISTLKVATTTSLKVNSVTLKATTTPSYQKGFVQNALSWVRGLFRSR